MWPGVLSRWKTILSKVWISTLLWLGMDYLLWLSPRLSLPRMGLRLAPALLLIHTLLLPLLFFPQNQFLLVLLLLLLLLLLLQVLLLVLLLLQLSPFGKHCCLSTFR